MTFAEIYDRIITLWPEEVPISDGYQTTESEGHVRTPSNVPADGEAYYFAALSKIWYQVEEEVGHEDTWGALMVWTMFQVFHGQSRELFKAGAVSLNTREVVPATIEEQYFLNLQTNGWEEERLAYERA